MLDNTRGWVTLSPRFTPGWPWPEDSYGLGPMYGDEGWCRGCGTPVRAQSGDLVVQGSKFPAAEVWMPNWRFDVVCVSESLAVELEDRFALELRDVRKPRTGPTGVRQLLPEETDAPWHPRAALEKAIRARHGEHYGEATGAQCAVCGMWKWLPVGESEAPISAAALPSESAVIASPEYFGSGLSSFRHLLFRRALAERLVEASPRNWDLVEVELR